MVPEKESLEGSWEGEGFSCPLWWLQRPAEMEGHGWFTWQRARASFGKHLVSGNKIFLGVWLPIYRVQSDAFQWSISIQIWIWRSMKRISMDMETKKSNTLGLGTWQVTIGTPILRCYPPQFGLKFVEIFHSLIADKLGMPELPPRVPPAEETFASLEFSDVWSEASMVSLCHYLRSGVHLKIPPSFRKLLPTKLWKSIGLMMS